MATAALSSAQRPPSTRPYAAHLYKPAGVKPVQLGIAWADAATPSLSSKIDLALPIRALRLILSGRLTIGGADFTSVNPEGLLNMISNIHLEGTNSRQGGDVSPWDIDLATAWILPHLFKHRAGFFRINGAQVPVPGTPFPATGATGYANKAQGNYDFEIGVDLPFHPYSSPPDFRPGYLVRKEEWADTLQLSFKFGHQANGATGFLGVGAGGSTVAWSQPGGGGGTPTLDVYSLPVQMGAIRNHVLPGVISRTSRPINTILQSAGAPISLAQLQRKRTSRLYVKTGTTANGSAFDTLNDNNVTALGIASGGNTKAIRPTVDVRAYKMNQSEDWGREPIQGYTCLDFIESGNPDSAYQAQNPEVIGDGTTFEVMANVAGVVNGYGIVIQEQILHPHMGGIYS
jgi:hypothetical protein